jgi:hypothetical protein
MRRYHHRQTGDDDFDETANEGAQSHACGTAGLQSLDLTIAGIAVSLNDSFRALLDVALLVFGMDCACGLLGGRATSAPLHSAPFDGPRCRPPPATAPK